MEIQTHGWPLHTKILLGLLIGAALGIAANVYAQRVPAAQETVHNLAGQLADPPHHLVVEGDGLGPERLDRQRNVQREHAVEIHAVAFALQRHQRGN